MSNLQLGSLVLNTELLVYLAAGIIGVLALSLGSRQTDKALRDKDGSIAWSTVVLWILVWKGSLILTDPVHVIQHPMSLVFFSGGRFGFWLASAAAILFSLYRFRKLHGIGGAASRVALLASGWTLVYSVAVLALDRPSFSYGHSLGLLLAIAGLVLLRRLDRSDARDASRTAEPEQKRRMATQGAVALLAVGLLSFTLHEQAQTGFIDKLLSGREGDSSTVGVRQGQLAPAIELADFAGADMSLEQRRGSVVIVNFWTTWCKVCKTEMPHVQKLYEHYSAQGDDVQLLSINVSSQEASVSGVERYMKEYGYSFPLALDEKGIAADRYRVKAFPATFIIDRDGTIRESMLGAISFSDMRKRVDRVLAL